METQDKSCSNESQCFEGGAHGDSEDVVDFFRVRHDGDGVDLDEFIERKLLKRERGTLFKHSRTGESKKSLFFVVKRRTKEVLFDIINENIARGTTTYTEQWGLCWAGKRRFGLKTINHTILFQGGNRRDIGDQDNDESYRKGLG